ncbi:MAG: type I methionyl aminopeptidase [Anaerolineaceae bacterium]
MSWDRVINLKSPAEIEIMREAGRINYAALEAARTIIRPGVTTADLNAAAEEVLIKHDAYSPFKNYPGPYPYPASICTSINEELVHGIPGKRKLEEGDIITMDCGTVFEGFVADSAITVGVGEISIAARKLIDITEEALETGITKMVAGLHVGDISSAIQEYAESRGYYVTRVYTGHGVGRQMHEGPQVPNYGEAGKGLELKIGMTIALEPMVLIGTPETRVLRDEWTVISTDRSLTAHFEHSVAVTAEGPMVLTLP